MKIVKSYLTKNPCYIRNRARIDARDRNFQDRGPRKLMLHSVGCAQPSAQAFVKRWNSPFYTRACVHAFIDAGTGTIYQTLPWNFRGWHAGKNAGNNIAIGVEMCESAAIKYTGGSSFRVLDPATARADAERAYKGAVALFAYLCRTYGLDPERDITSHVEGHKAGIASNHGDPVHYWKGLGLSYTMDGFRKDVRAAMAAGKTQQAAEDVRMRVSSKDGFLNVREVPGAGSKQTGRLKTGKQVKVMETETITLANGRRQEWAHIKAPSLGIDGWVNKAYLI